MDFISDASRVRPNRTNPKRYISSSAMHHVLSNALPNRAFLKIPTTVRRKKNHNCQKNHQKSQKRKERLSRGIPSLMPEVYVPNNKPPPTHKKQGPKRCISFSSMPHFLTNASLSQQCLPFSAVPLFLSDASLSQQRLPFPATPLFLSNFLFLSNTSLSQQCISFTAMPFKHCPFSNDFFT